MPVTQYFHISLPDTIKASTILTFVSLMYVVDTIVWKEKRKCSTNNESVLKTESYLSQNAKESVDSI